jgi:hypothetical protein
MDRKIRSVYCSKCSKHMGYIIYTRWIDYDITVCNECMKSVLENLLDESV